MNKIPRVLSASEMTYIVSSGALNSTHSLTLSLTRKDISKTHNNMKSTSAIVYLNLKNVFSRHVNKHTIDEIMCS